ncbi:MAG: hypothetical protein KDA90_08050 [Planctomycetaceae bacterium]|nr:hypothetical protein [Planctomycetaceae bacterium]
MTATEHIIDPYPASRKAVNAAFEAMVSAASVLKRDDLSAAQRKELAGIIAERARDLSDLAARIQSSD